MHQDLSGALEPGREPSRAAARQAVQWMRLRGVAILGLCIVIYWWVRLEIG